MKGKKRWKLAAGIILATLFGGSVWMLWPAPEPVYDGKSVSHWLGGDWLVWGHDAPVTFVPSTNDYPYLMRMVATKGTVRSEQIKQWLNQKNWFKVKFRSVAEINLNGLQGLFSMGKKLQFAVPDLILRYDQAAPGSFERDAICLVLFQMGPDVKAASRCFIDTLANDPRQDWREQAALSLRQLQLPAEVAVPALSKSLGDSSSFVRYQAARGLGEFGSNAVSALPALRILAGSKVSPQRHKGRSLSGQEPDSLPFLHGNFFGTNDVDAAALAIIRIMADAQLATIHPN